jgi:hypothetical protein
VAKLSIPQVYNLLRQAGFSPAAAAEMTGIAISESGLNPTIEGDQALQNSTYGTSVGLFQVRTVRAETGKGTDRDKSALLASPARQAQAAYEISHGGKDFRPWSTWLHGSAQAQLPAVLRALGVSSLNALGGGLVPAGPLPAGSSAAGGPNAVDASLTGVLTAPLGWVGNLLGVTGISGSVAKVALFGALVITGGALVVVGAAKTVAPTVEAVQGKIQQGAETAAPLVAAGL